MKTIFPAVVFLIFCSLESWGQCTAPTTQASNITFNNVQSSYMTVYCSAGNGSKRAIYINTSNSFFAPSNGSDPYANSVYSSGQQCIYNGTGTYVSVTGLSQGVTYYFRVYEGNCTGSQVKWNTNTASNNPKSQMTPCVAPNFQSSQVTFTDLTSTSMRVNWQAGNGTRRVMKINTTNTFTTPADGTDPTANTVYSGSGEQVVYNSTLSTVLITGLSPGNTYWVRIYEANCNGTSSKYYAATAPLNPTSQAITCTAPTTQASNITFSGINSTSMTVDWTNGNGSNRIVKINTSNTFTAPVNGTDPTANSTYSGSGQQVVYNGSGSSFTVSGLSSSTTYWFRVYEANCSGTNIKFSTASGTNNPKSQATTGCAAPTTQATNVSFSNISGSSFTINWTNGNGSRRVVKMNTTNSFTAPANATDPTANTVYSSGQQVMYNGTGNSVTVTGLSSGVTYWVRVYEANCTGSQSNYNTSTATNNPGSQTAGGCIAPTVQANNITFSSVTGVSMNFSVSPGNGSRFIVKINTSNNFTAPANGTDPTANSVYSGSGEQVIYNGNSLSWLPVTGLAANTTYWFRAYAANCSGTSSLYNTSTATDNPISQATQNCPLPTTQANNITFSSINSNSMTVNWTNGNGSRRVVIINTSNSFTAPSNTTNPTANPVYGGSGQQVVYNGSSNSVTVTGLSASTTYWFRVYEANCTGYPSIYLTTTATNNPSSQATSSGGSDPCTNITNISGCGTAYSQTYTGGGAGQWFTSTNNPCSYPTPGIEKIYSFVAPATGTYSLQLTAASGYVDYMWKANTCASSGWTCIDDIDAPGNYGSMSWTQGTTYYILLDDEDNITGTHTFYINCPCSAPTTQATNLTFSSITTTGMTAGWTNGNGSRRVVKMNTSNSFTAPASGTDPTASTVYSGSGEQVVYNGTGSNVSVTGLTANTTYWFRVYEASCTGTASLYLTTTGTNNPLSQATSSGGSDPCSNITSISGCGASYAQTYTGGGAGQWFTSTNNPCSYPTPGIEKIYSFVAPATGTYNLQVTAASGWVDYMWKANTCASSGWTCIDDIDAPGNYGSMSWTQGTTYYILLDDEDNITGTHTFYINCPCSAPTTQATNLTFSSITTTGMTAGWTNGNGSRRIVKINTSNSFTAPASGTDPTANTAYSGSGEQVVYNGTGSSVSVTGLTSNTTYWFRVYEASCTGTASLYLTTTGTNNPKSQATSSGGSDPCSNITSISGCGASYAQTYTGGGAGQWFTSTNNACSYPTPGIEKIYSFVAPATGNYGLQITAASGYVDYM